MDQRGAALKSPSTVQEIMSPPRRTKGYKYAPLPDPSTHLRLLEITEQSTDSGPEIRCTLSAWPMNDAPTYIAISYTWGPREPTEIVLVDGHPRSIRKNCADVLRQILHFKMERYYFIDAICIDQDSVEEKNHQVAVMSQIFFGARLVLACLGFPDAKLQPLMQLLDSIRTAKDYHFAEQLKCREYYWGLSETGKFRLHRSLDALSAVRYFSRVWIVPEIILAQSVTFCIGLAQIKLSTLHLLLLGFSFSVWEAYEDRALDGSGQWNRDICFDLLAHVKLRASEMDNVRCTKSILELFNRRFQSHVLQPYDPCRRDCMQEIDVESALALTIDRRCEDPHDIVFGALAMSADNSGTGTIEVDYSTPPFDLAKKCIETCSLSPAMARSLLVALGVSKNDAQVREGICERRGNQAVPSETRSPYRRRNEARRHYVAWQTLTSMHRSSCSHCSHWNRLKNGLQILRSLSGKTCGIACRSMQTNDLLAYENIQSKDQERGRFSRALVLRPVAKQDELIVLEEDGAAHKHVKPRVIRYPEVELFTIVGQAFVDFSTIWNGSDCNTPERYSLRCIEVLFDVEDLIIYESSTPPVIDVKWVEFGCLAVEECLETRVCRAPMSTWAFDSEGSASVRRVWDSEPAKTLDPDLLFPRIASWSWIDEDFRALVEPSKFAVQGHEVPRGLGDFLLDSNY